MPHFDKIVKMGKIPTMRTLFLNAPSFAGFDGGAGSRYQAAREIRSFWFPTWLAQPAALIKNSKIIDAPADGLNLEQVLQMARGFEFCVIHTSTPSFENDARVAAALKDAYPDMLIGFVGAHVAVLPDLLQLGALAEAGDVSVRAGSLLPPPGVVGVRNAPKFFGG